MKNSVSDNYTFPSYLFYAARQAIRRHATGGNILIFAAVLAFIVANSSIVGRYYSEFWQLPMHLQIGDFNILSHNGKPMSVLEFINDALMAVFFFSIGLEIKREILVGELSSFKKALLPVLAAVGGMIVPVVIFLIIAGDENYVNGAAIPMATDIAFSLGILTLLGTRVPLSLKIFLTTLAVVDDIGGIIVIAVFYSTHIDVVYIFYAVGSLCLLLMGGVMKVRGKIFYLGIGGVVWFLFLNSGIHSTIAGVLVAFCVPATPVLASQKYVKTIREAISHFDSEKDIYLDKKSVLTNEQLDLLKCVESASDKVISPLQELEDLLHPIVNYFILPLFAFANAGIYLFDMEPAPVFEGISLAIICGLFFGKFIGIFTFSWLAVKLRFVSMPEYSNWKMIASVAMLGGIGFTVSLFIANLSFANEMMVNQELLNHAKMGIVVGSIISGIVGYVLLHFSLPKQPIKL